MLSQVFKPLGSSNHCKEERQSEDFYATDSYAIDILCDVEKFDGTIWEPCCGNGNLSERLIQHGYCVCSSDLINRGYGITGVDFFKEKISICDNIITNPPYSNAQSFIEHALKILPNGCKLALFLKLTFLEGKKRKIMFLQNPPQTLYVSSSRILCAKNGDFETARKNGSAIGYGWYIWVKGYNGETKIRWVN